MSPGLLRAADKQMPVVRIGGLAERGLPGHSGIDPLGSKGNTGVRSGHIDDLNVFLRETSFAQKYVDEELRDRPFFKSDLLAFQAGYSLDLLVGHESIAAIRIINGQDVLQRLSRLHVDWELIDGGSDHINSPGHQRTHFQGCVLHDRKFHIDSFFLEEAFVTGNIKGPISYPG